MFVRVFLLSAIVLSLVFSCKEDETDCVPLTFYIDSVQLIADIAIIDQYLSDSSIVAIEHESGLRYVIHAEGDGLPIQSCTGVSANYSGYFLDGTYFDSSIEAVAREKGVFNVKRNYAPFNFIVDQDFVIGGWHEGFKLLSKGTKATLYIPSSLGYGADGYLPAIPPDSQLIFDVEVVDTYTP